jgi:hypothetical protein
MFPLKGQNKTSAAFIGMPLQGGNRLHRLTQGAALGYSDFGDSAQRKNFLPMQNPGIGIPRLLGAIRTALATSIATIGGLIPPMQKLAG